MSYATMPIVGAFYRPPAKVLITVLPIGCPLKLYAEPDNPADANAVAVYLASKDIPDTAHDELGEALPQFGFDLAQVLAQEEWHLGYVPKEMAKQLRDADIVMPSVPVDVTFSLNAKGNPRIRFAEEVL